MKKPETDSQVESIQCIPETDAEESSSGKSSSEYDVLDKESSLHILWLES